MTYTRRGFLATSARALAAPLVVRAAEDNNKPESLAREVGITTASVARHLAAGDRPGKLTMLELPRVLRDQLDMRVLDVNTNTLGSLEPSALDRFRDAAEKAGCILTNLKMNQSGLDMSSPDPAVRHKALAEYKRSIDAAARLGMRWVRPLPLKHRPDMDLHVASYGELADYAAGRRVQVVVENYGWMESAPDSVVKLIKAVGKNVAASPDTGNWVDNEVRYRGLAQTFPLAVTCDFKALNLEPNGEHKFYDLKRCFTIGWDAGFRGPWCLEHVNADVKTLFKELGLLRGLLRKWMAERA